MDKIRMGGLKRHAIKLLKIAGLTINIKGKDNSAHIPHIKIMSWFNLQSIPLLQLHHL